jgi:hypothetical protein
MVPRDPRYAVDFVTLRVYGQIFEPDGGVSAQVELGEDGQIGVGMIGDDPFHGLDVRFRLAHSRAELR